MASQLQRRLQRALRPPVAQDVERELDFHLEMRSRELKDQGLDPSAARQEALRQFGDRPSVERSCRRIVRRHIRNRERTDRMDRLRSDLRLAVRRLTREPLFTLGALATLALGIGANTATFSLLHGILLEPLPFSEPERLVMLWEVDDRGRSMRVSNPNFEDWKEQASAFEELAVLSTPSETTVVGGLEPLRAAQSSVGRGFFEALKPPLRWGRTFLPEEQVENGIHAVVVSSGFWIRALGGNEDLESLRLRISGVEHRVVGVLAPGFEFPEDADLWTAKEIQKDESSRNAHNWGVLGRLRPEVELAAAAAEMTALSDRLYRTHGSDTDALDAAVVPLQDELVRDSRQALWLLLGAAGLVLLIACANLGGTMLAKAVRRRRELALRAALGAGRSTLMQQLLTESLLLTLAGAVLGVGLAALLLKAMLTWLPPDLPRLANVELDPSVLLYTSLIAVMAGVFLSVFPSFVFRPRSLTENLRDGDKSVAGTGKSRAWNLLLASEVALALVLLVGCGLLIRSAWHLAQVAAGFDPKNLVVLDLTVPVPFPPWGDDLEPIYQAEQEVARHHDRFLEEVERTPGVQGSTLTSRLPLRGVSTTAFYRRDLADEEMGYAGYLVVSPSYFRVLGIPVLSGRSLQASDRPGTDHVAVISNSLARRLWPKGDALGQQIRPPGMDSHGDRWLTIVGIVGDVRQRSLREEPTDLIYVSYRQRAFRTRWATVVARIDADPGTVLPSLRARIRSLHPELPLNFSSMAAILGQSNARARFSTVLLAAFAIVALILAASGIWSVVTYHLARRRRELGIRLALGAAPARLIRAVLRQTLAVVALGIAVGTAAALILNRSLKTLLFQVESTDIWTLAITIILLTAVSWISTALPAYRVARIDPLESLREE